MLEHPGQISNNMCTYKYSMKNTPNQIPKAFSFLIAADSPMACPKCKSFDYSIAPFIIAHRTISHKSFFCTEDILQYHYADATHDATHDV